MNTTEIRELNAAELDLVSGGEIAGYKECPMGTKQGGPAGLYPHYADCSKGALTDLAELVLATAAQGRVILSGGGSPA